MFFDSFLEKKMMMQSSKQGEESMLRLHFQQLQHGNQYERPAEYSISEDSSRSTGGEIRKHYNLEGGKDGAGEKRILAAGDWATIEVAKRRRGRPPGSRNKPKLAPFAAEMPQPPLAAAASGMGCHVLEIPSGGDVVDMLARFARRRGIGVCVLGASGAVANVALRQQPPAAAVVFRGRFEILSMSATVLPPAMVALGSTGTTVSVSMAVPGGHVVGGTVAGPLTAAGMLVVVTAGFANPTFHRLPAEDDVSVSVSVSEGSDEAEENKHQSEHRRSIYGGHVSPDVVWPPASRPPLPPPY